MTRARRLCSNLAEQNVSYNSEGLAESISQVCEDEATEELSIATKAIFVAGIEENKEEDGTDFDIDKASISI